MPPGPTPGEPAPRDLEAELDAERAATDHWRRVARQRSAEYAALRHRTSIRALLAAERKLAPIRQPIVAARARLGARASRLALRARALGHHPDRHLVALRDAVGRLPPPPAEPRRFDLIEIDATGPGHETVAAVRQAIDATDGELIVLVLGTTDPLEAGWPTRVLAALGDDVVAAGPVLVHPARPAAFATPHDGLVRAAGLGLGLDADGVPTVVARDAGTVADPDGQIHEVDALSGAAFVVTRAAYDAAGGLPLGDDLDVAVVELSCALRAGGGRVVIVPAAVVFDGTPVGSTAELSGPIDAAGPAWVAAIDRSGPALRRSVRPLDDGLRFVVTVAAPSDKVATRWGDWHLAEGLAGGLRRLGHEVRIQIASRADEPASRVADVHLVLRGLQPVRRTAGQRHVLWIISHPESIEDDELDAADLVLVASPRFAEHLRGRTTTPVDVFLQATDQHRFFPRPLDPTHAHAVTFVGKTRDVMRPVVRDALAVGIRPAIYGGGWRELVDPRLVVADHVDNEDLPVVYSSAGVVLNDHWRTMQTWGFASNRLFDVLACGIPVISDPVVGLATLFGGCVLEYDAPAELRRLVDEVLTDPTTARARAERGRKLVVERHTFDHRAHELVQAVTRLAQIT